MLHPSADLPHSAVAASPVLYDVLGKRAHKVPRLLGDLAVQPQQGVYGRDDLAEHVHLQVLCRAVADAHGPGVLVSAQVVEDQLFERRLLCYAV